MKPACPSDLRRAGRDPDDAARRFPRTDYFFQSRFEEGRGFSSPYDGQGRFRNFRNLSREYYGAAAREYLREMIAFGFVIAASAWLVLYMIFVVVKLLGRPHP